MVIIHIANIDTSVVGGVQFAVPEMVKSQSHYADICLLNTHGEIVDGIQNIRYDGEFDVEKFRKPYNKPDLVVFHEVYRFEYISIYRELVRLGIPYIIIPHGCLSEKAQRKKRIKKAIANVIFFNRFIKNARFVQYLSNNERTMSAFQKYPYVVVGNGVSIPAEKKSCFSKSEVKFVYIGRLEIHIKGLDLLLSAVKKSESLLRQIGAVFELYGPDYNDAHETITQMIHKLNIADLVRLDKEKMGVEKQRILLSATCFVQTSRTEGLPLGPLEALSYGLPCIVTRGVGLGEMINSYGAGYMSENTVDGISESIELFIQDIDKAEMMSQSAIRLIEKNFDIDIIAKNTIDEYYDMLN